MLALFPLCILLISEQWIFIFFSTIGENRSIDHLQEFSPVPILLFVFVPFSGLPYFVFFYPFQVDASHKKSRPLNNGSTKNRILFCHLHPLETRPFVFNCDFSPYFVKIHACAFIGFLYYIRMLCRSEYVSKKKAPWQRKLAHTFDY